MLIKGVTAIGTKIRIIIPTQRWCALIKAYSTSSSSSSDSDSDTEHPQKINKREQYNNNRNTSRETSIINTLIDEITQKSNNRRTMDVAIPLKINVAKNKLHKRPDLSYGSQLTKAVKNVTNVLNGNKKEIKLELLDKLSHMHKNKTNTTKQDSFRNINELETKNMVKNEFEFTKNNRDTYNIKSQECQNSIIHKLKAQQDKQIQKLSANNIDKINENITKNQHQYQADSKEKIKSVELSIRNSTIFKNMEKHKAIVPELSVWKSLEQRELALIFNQTPQNIFQEMIQWTESGKLWKFPIDNECGMEEEHNVHFSEHVFLEHHLKDWCPKRGPIRHFMELVCIGLSKNPYITVDEKIEHITWYKEYFKGKEELLKELGAIDVSSSMKKQIKI